MSTPKVAVVRHRLPLLLAAMLASAPALAVPFTISITNTGTNTAYDWSTGLLTLSPLIAVGPVPQPGNAAVRDLRVRQLALQLHRCLLLGHLRRQRPGDGARRRATG